MKKFLDSKNCYGNREYIETKIVVHFVQALIKTFYVSGNRTLLHF